VGRKPEIEFLQSRLVEEDRGYVLLEGEPGTGKTRLAQELAALARDSGFTVLTGHCYNGEPAASLFPLLQIMSAAGAGDSDAEKILAELRLPSTASILTGMGDPRPVFFARFIDRIAASACGKPLLLVVEDIHWADSDTLLFLNNFLDTQASAMSLLCTARSGQTAAVDGLYQALRAKCGILSVGPLAPEESAALARQLAAGLGGEEVEFLCKTSGGNPFFLVELVSHLSASGLLDTNSATDVLRRRGLPSSLVKLIDLRLQNLEEKTEAALEAASVVGPAFDPELVAVAAGLSVEEVEDALAEAERAGIVSYQDWPAVAIMEFAHPLFRERLYGRLKRKCQRDIHRRLALADESCRSLLSVESLATHHAIGLKGEERAIAAETCCEAAERAERVLAFAAAAAFWELALSCTPANDLAGRAKTLRRLGLAYRAASNWNRAIPALEQAFEASTRLQRTNGAGELAYFIGEMQRFRFKLDAAVLWLKRALDLAEDASTQRLKCLALLGSAYVALSREPEGVPLLREALEGSEVFGSIPPDVAFGAFFGFTVSGQFEAARDMAVRGLEEADRLGNEVYAALLAGGLAITCLAELEPERAAEYVARLESSSGPHDAVSVVRALVTRCFVEGFYGRWRSVQDICEAWLGRVRLAGRFQVATAQMMWAEATSCLGDQARALSAVDEALPYLETMRPTALIHKARMLWRMGELAGAREVLIEADLNITATQRLQALRGVAADLAPLLLMKSREELVRLYEVLSAEQRPLVMVYSLTSVQRALGKIAATLGRWRGAFEHFETALGQLAPAGADWELAMTYLDYAAARRLRGRKADRLKAEALEAQGCRLLVALGVDPDAWVSSPSPASPRRPYALTPRELEVLVQVAAGSRNAEIAECLSVQVGTVNRHLESIYRKLGAKGRAQAVLKAAGEGLIFPHGEEAEPSAPIPLSSRRRR